MKTSRLIGIAIALSVILLGATAIFAQQPNGQHHSNGGQVHQMYFDENGDGINDNVLSMHQGMNNGGMMHNQNQSGSGHQNGGQGMHSGGYSTHNSGMMDDQYHCGMGYQNGMGYHGGMNGSSGMGGGYGSHGSMGRH